MATITSAGTGAWSAAGTWDSGVPVNNDVVVIASGHTVTFDVDQSGFADGIAGITVTGTLKLTRTAGTYYMKIKTATYIGGAGTFDCGISIDPIPFTAKHTITGGANWYITGASGMTMTVYGAEPVYNTIRLSATEAAGQTELSVDTDVTGDIWADGDTVVVVRAAKNTYQVEERVIAGSGISSSTITITAGLTAEKPQYSLIHLVTRGLKFISVGTTAITIQDFDDAGKLTIGGGAFIGSNYRMFQCENMVFNNGIVYNNNIAFYNSHSMTFNDGVLTNVSGYGWNANMVTINGGIISGCSQSITNSLGFVVTDGIFTGCTYVFLNVGGSTISGGSYNLNQHVFYSCDLIVITGGSVTNNLSGFYANNTGFIISGMTLSGNTSNIDRLFGSTLYEIVFTDGTEYSNYGLAYYNNVTESISHDGVDGAYKAWARGGITTSQTTTVPTGYVYAYIMALESATYPCFFKRTFTVASGESVNVEVQLRKDASMTYLPRAYLMDSIGNPLVGASPYRTFTMTDSIDTWESDTFAITNSTDYNHDYTLWFVGKNATGNVISAYSIETVPDTSDIADAVWNALLSNYTDAGSAGKAMSDILTDTGTDIPAALTTIDDFLDTEIAAIKAKTDLIPTDPAETSDIPSAATITDAVWDELLSGHAIAGSAGAYLAASGASPDPLLNTVPGSYASGTAGAALGRIGSGQITTVSPVAQNGDVETVMGDDYNNTDARALDWTDSSASWPTLTSATIAVTIRGVSSYAGSVVTATGDSKKVRLQLTDVQTAAIPAGWYPFQVIATLSSANVVTLVEGNWLSKERLSST